MSSDKNPQLEEGYTRISNELLEAICRYEFTANDLRLLWAILRHTYGWGKKKSVLSLSFLAKATGIPRRSVEWNLKHLRARNIILREDSKTGIQKDYSKWALGQSITAQPITLGQPIALPPATQPIALEVGQPIALLLGQPIAHKERKEKKEEIKLLPASQVFSDKAILRFEEKYKTKPTWTTPDYVQLAKLLKARTGITVAEFEQRYSNFLESPQSFHQQQGGSLKFFASHYDSFIRGNGNGKLTGSARTEQNIRAGQEALRMWEDRERRNSEASGSPGGRDR